MDNKFRALVAEATDHAKLVAWDTCHKIYVAMDDTEARWYMDHADRGYQCFVGTPDAMLEQVCEWYKKANADCGLQYIDATSWSDEDQNTKFHRVIPQDAQARWDWTTQDDSWERKESA